MMRPKTTMATERWASGRRWRRVPSALLAVSIALGGLPGVTWAADEPDLKLEDVRLFVNKDGQVNEQVVSFKVTNVGDRDAPEGTGTLEIRSPAPVREEALKIPKLAKNGGSFEGFAQLGTPCDGHIVRIAVSTPGETNFDENTVGPLKLCPDKPKPAPQPMDPKDVGIVTRFPGTDPSDLVLPEHLRPGTHELKFEPTALRSMSRNTYGGVHRGPYDDSRDPDWMWVGWDRASPLYDFRVSQTAVNFDLAKLLEVNRPFVSQAHLSFVEHEQDWDAGHGQRADVVGCVAALGFATNDWGVPPQQFMSQDFLFRDRHLTDVFISHTTTEGEPGSIRRWRAFDVTGHLRSQMSYRDDPELWFGYVLRGGVDDPGGPRGACVSKVSSLRLWVTYVVPSN